MSFIKGEKKKKSSLWNSEHKKDWSRGEFSAAGILPGHARWLGREELCPLQRHTVTTIVPRTEIRNQAAWNP